MEEYKVEIKKSLENQKDLHDNTVSEIKSEAQASLLNVKLDLEMQLKNQKVEYVKRVE